MIQETLDDLKSSIASAHEALKRELQKLRTGRASPDLLESIRVDYYGSMTPLRQMATISVPEPRMLLCKPFDRSSIKTIEKAIMESDLNLNPQNDGEVIRIPLPALTEERRRDLVKIAKKYGEESKIAIRQARHGAKDMLDSLEKEKVASADDIERAKKELEEIVKAGTAKVDEIVAKREKDILEV